MLRLHVADVHTGEEGGKALEVERTPRHGARFEGVGGCGHPPFAKLVKRQARVVRNREIPDLAAQFGQTAFGQLAVLGAQGASKLLVTSLDQSVIPATRFQTIQVLRHPMKHYLSSISLCLSSKSFGFHAQKLTVTIWGDKANIVKSEDSCKSFMT